jgi:hypothetical protein
MDQGVSESTIVVLQGRAVVSYRHDRIAMVVEAIHD